MPSFPTLHRGAEAHVGTTRTVKQAVEIVQFADDSEQRWIKSPPLNRFTLVFRYLDGVDVSNIRQFFNDQKGRFGTDWDITINGDLYENMTFDQDDFSPTEPADKPELFHLTLKARQVE